MWLSCSFLLQSNRTITYRSFIRFLYDLAGKLLIFLGRRGDEVLQRTFRPIETYTSLSKSSHKVSRTHLPEIMLADSNIFEVFFNPSYSICPKVITHATRPWPVICGVATGVLRVFCRMPQDLLNTLLDDDCFALFAASSNPPCSWSIKRSPLNDDSLSQISHLLALNPNIVPGGAALLIKRSTVLFFNSSHPIA